MYSIKTRFHLNNIGLTQFKGDAHFHPGPVEIKLFEMAKVTVRDRLDSAAIDQAWAEGRRMTKAEAAEAARAAARAPGL